MSRRLAFAAATLFLLAPAAQAKAPPDGVRVCGSSGCVSLSQADAEQLAVWHAGEDGAVAPRPPAPYFSIQFRWQPGAPLQTIYWVPSQHAFRSATEYLIAWRRDDDGALARITAGIEPYQVPTPTRVTVGGTRVRGAATYLRLFFAGRATNVWPAVEGWLDVRFTAPAPPSPWTDPSAHVRVSASGGYLLRDDTVFRIPLRLADRIRHRLPLS